MSVERDTLKAAALQWTLGDSDAANLIMALSRMMRLVDDVADGDSHDVPRDLALAAHEMLVEIAANAFYQKHFATLAPLVSLCGLRWAKSEQWRESEDETRRMFAFVGRESVEIVLHMIALLRGGPRHALLVMDEAFDLLYCGPRAESFAEWDADNGVRKPA